MRMMNPTVKRKLTSLSMITRSSLLGNIEISFMQIFIKERRKSERRCYNHITINIIVVLKLRSSTNDFYLQKKN